MASATLAIACFAAPAANAQQVSEQRVQELVRQAAERVGLQPSAPVNAAQGAAGSARPTVRLSLEDAVKAALDHNLDIAVQRLNPAVQDISYASLASIYRPTLTSTLATQQQTNASTSTIAGGQIAGAPIDTSQQTFNAGYLQNIQRFGSSLSVNLNNARNTTASLNTLFNPTYNNLWQASYTQPIMKGRTIDQNRQQLQVSRINRDISDVQLRASITNTLSNVRNAYWDYVFAVQAVEVAKNAVGLAERLVQDNQTRVQVGTMAPIDVIQAQSQAATSRQNLAVAQGTMRTNEIALKRLLVAGTSDPLWNQTIDPVDRPDFAPQGVDVEGAIRRALTERTDLAIARQNIQSNNVTLGYLSNQLLPQTDLIATYGRLGLGGTQLRTTGSGVNQAVVGTIPGGYGDALATIFGTPGARATYPRWNVTLNFSYPLGLSAAKATVARAKVQLSQDQAQMRQIELQVATEITNAAVNIQSNVERVQAAQAAREFAQRQLDAENSKFEVGMSTNFLVVQAQQTLANAQNNELQAILNYRKSIVEFDRLQQTTLQNLNVTIVSAALR
jgi:outer membrane protein TolC